MSTTFLALSIAGLALTVNAMRPARWSFLTAPAFFASWLTMELAPHVLAIHAGAVSAFAAAGALEGWRGAAGIALSALTGLGLAALIVEAQRVRRGVEGALREALGPDYLARIPPRRPVDYDLRVPWRRLLLPFRMRHPDVERVRNLPYGPHGRRNVLDVYRHRSRPTGCPVLLQIHGGGWAISNKDQQGKPIMLHFASRGWVCVAPNYRLSPRATFPDHLVDLKRALAWVREHGPEYGADPGFVVVTGGSAGGHLASMLALTQNDPEYQPGFEGADTSVQGCAPSYGVYDFTNEAEGRTGGAQLWFIERYVMKKRLAEDREEFEKASPQYRVRQDAPPFFVVHGAHDSLVPVGEARRFVARLRAVSQAPVVYAELPGAQHAFDVFPSVRTAHVIRAVERFADYAYGLAPAGKTERAG